MKILNKYIYLLILLSISILINPEFLKHFTIDGEINLKGIKLILYIFSIIFFILFAINFFKKSKKILLNFLSILFFFLISILISEYFLDKFSDKIENKKEIRFDKNYEFSAKYEINSLGYRGKEIQFNLNDKKIYLIGDSFVFGSAVDEPYTIDKLLKKNLDKNNLNYNIINLGIPGTNPDDYLKTLKKYIKHKPKYIFMFIYLDNDININMQESFLGKINQIIENSFLFKKIFLVFSLNSNYFKSDIYLNQFEIPNSTYKIFKNEHVNPHILAIANRGMLDDYYAKINKYGFINSLYYKNLFKDAKNISEKNNSIFYLVLIPSKFQVKKKYVDFASNHLGYKFKEKKIIGDELQKNIVFWAKKENINIIDLTKGLKNTKKDNYYLIDDHFNQNGNLIASDIISKTLINQK